MTDLLRELSQFRSASSNHELIAVSPVVVRRKVAFGECDPAGIVYTPRFADYIVETYFWFSAVASQDLGSSFEMPMRSLQIDFRSMLSYGAWFEMRCLVGDIRSRSFDLVIEARSIRQDIAFIGRLSPVAVDFDTRSAIAIPMQMRERLFAYRDAHAHLSVPVSSLEE